MQHGYGRAAVAALALSGLCGPLAAIDVRLAPDSYAGRVTTTSRPPPGRACACALPPCPRAIARTIERPSP